MNRAQSLIKFLREYRFGDRMLAEPSAFDCQILGGEVKPRFKNKNGSGMVAAEIRYNVEISIAPCVAPPELVGFLASVWANQNAGEKDELEVAFEVDQINDTAYEIILQLKGCVDEIVIYQDEKGPISAIGKRWTFDEQAAWIAESFDLNVNAKD